MNDIEKYLKVFSKKSYDEKTQKQVIKNFCEARSLDSVPDESSQQTLLKSWKNYLDDIRKETNLEETKLRILYIVIYERVSLANSDYEKYITPEFLSIVLETIQLLMEKYVPKRVNLYFGEIDSPLLKYIL